MVSEKTIQIMMEKKKITVSNQDFLTSYQVREYFSKLSCLLLGGGKTIHVEIINQEEEERIAFWRKQRIVLNCGHEFIAKRSFLWEQFELLKGLFCHELSHEIHTDFTAFWQYEEELNHGTTQVDLSAIMPSHMVATLRAIKKFQGKGEMEKKAYEDVALQLYNMLEDAYVEAAFFKKYPGALKESLEYVRSIQYEELMEEIKTKPEGFEAYFLLMLCYAKYGVMPYVSWDKDQDRIEETKKLIKESCTKNDCLKKKQCVEKITILYWHELNIYLEDQIKKQGMNAPKVSSFSALWEKEETAFESKTEEETNVEFGDIPKKNTITKRQQGKNEMVMEQMIEKYTISKAKERLEEKRVQELNDYAKALDYRPGNERISVYVERKEQITPQLKDKYEKVSGELIDISKRLQKNVKEKILLARRGGKCPNQYFGRKLDSKSLIRKDGRYFYRNILPDDDKEIAIGILVDESGSMREKDRQKWARNTAIILYDFCKQLGFPVCIYGHSADHRGPGTVGIYSYVEFDTIDNMDQYRLMGISARARNRDGVAIRFVGERLKERKERRKLLIVISDGKPNAHGYGGEYAKKELGAIKRELSNEHIKMLVAAIGDDKDEIESIYKDGFLDITNLERLPAVLTNLIKRILW